MGGCAQGGLTVLHKSSGNGLGLLNCWPRKQFQELVHTGKRKELHDVCVCMCVHVHVHVCARVYMCVHVHVHVCACASVCSCRPPYSPALRVTLTTSQPNAHSEEHIRSTHRRYLQAPVGGGGDEVVRGEGGSRG